MIAPDTVPVLSLLVTAPASGRIYLGVRRPVRTSHRHPNVLSTLTMRVPPPLMQTACDDARIPLDADEPSVLQRPESAPATELIGQPLGMSRASIFMAETLLARKLEVGGLLVDGRLQGELTPLGATFDVVQDPKGDGRAEATLMLTYRLNLTAGLDLLPTSTASYSQLEWVESRDLQTALDTNDALLLVPDADPFEVCIHGLCVRSAAIFLGGATQ